MHNKGQGASSSSGSTSFCVAIIGSSGGGTATLGHTNPSDLLETIHAELRKIEGAGVSRACFVALDGGKGFDSVVEDRDSAALYQVKKAEANRSTTGALCEIIKTGTLKEVNGACKEIDQDIADCILAGKIRGLICISCSVEVFNKTLQAAADKKIPVTGTGGTSLSAAASKFHIRLVGNAGGSVANTSLTRAVSYAHALATDWNVAYRPWRNNVSTPETNTIAIKSVLNACLPVFWGVCLTKRGLESLLSVLGSPTMVNNDTTIHLIELLGLCITVLENHVLPTACAVVLATSSTNGSQDTSSLIMATILASCVCWRSVLGGLLAGWMVSVYQRKLLYLCIVNNIPATMTNLVTSGGIGGATALALLPIAPLLRRLTELIRWTILQSVSSSVVHPACGGFLWGCFCCYGSKVGWYHAFFLPMILIEMECGNASFLGAIDELTLVLTCAGVCLGNLVFDQMFPKKGVLSEADLSLSTRAVYINLLCGDFVEACYPFMDRFGLINFGCYLGSGMSSAFLVMGHDENVPLSLAYLPLPVSIWLAGSGWGRFVMSSVIALVVPFVFTILSHRQQLMNRPS